LCQSYLKNFHRFIDRYLPISANFSVPNASLLKAKFDRFAANFLIVRNDNLAIIMALIG
jgi:hypothetical protein